MTLNYDQDGYAYDMINWTYDGDEIIYELDPVEFIYFEVTYVPELQRTGTP